ncbi:MAG: hypothetical protein N4J56_006703 [Chroococcidiopsis sp. SAG 2025]|uniref:hypothetical protein n=1 Tax=Chroococcidiopsis sp. SAG 2025 TaxID=171389 RepID=UPI002936FD15|nr:hypothetical protein [Chroococcidiopsis sp. SAG 2025]MDV2996998.1 hypothetical protein [Chroococcidiopsis sp. SAG 2025]
MLNAGIEPTPAPVEILEELTPDEERERHRLEIRVDRALGEGWSALKQLRDLRLYRSTHGTFEEYAKERFGYNRAHAYRLISAAAVLENLAPLERLEEMSPNWRQKMPVSESQCRELAKLPANKQPKAWEKVLSVSGDKAPTAQIVKTVVERMKEKQLFPARDFCAVGDVFTLTRLQSRERKYNGYPCVALVLKDFTIEVDIYDGTLIVKPENLKPIDDPDVCRQLPTILKRIKRVRDTGLLDRGAYYVLDGLGRQTYLTDFEEKLLSLLEQEHGINS